MNEVLLLKHPVGQPACPDSLMNGTPPRSHPVIFEALDANLIRSMALQTNGAAGPSGLDAFAWRRLCTSFKSASDNLCHAMALTARRIACEHIDPACLSPLLVCRLAGCTG